MLLLQVGNVSELFPALTHAKQSGLYLALHMAEVSSHKLYTSYLLIFHVGIKQ